MVRSMYVIPRNVLSVAPEAGAGAGIVALPQNLGCHKGSYAAGIMSREKARKDLYPEHKAVLGTLLSILPGGLNAIHAEDGSMSGGPQHSCRWLWPARSNAFAM